MEPGRLLHRVTLQQAGAPVPDGTGGYTEGLTTLISRAPAAIEPATAASLERLGANTISPMATHLVMLRYVPGVTTKTEAIFHDDGVDRALAITGVYDFEARHKVLELVCVETDGDMSANRFVFEGLPELKQALRDLPGQFNTEASKFALAAATGAAHDIKRGYPAHGRSGGASGHRSRAIIRRRLPRALR